MAYRGSVSGVIDEQDALGKSIPFVFLDDEACPSPLSEHELEELQRGHETVRFPT